MAIFGDVAEVQFLSTSDLGQTISNTWHISRASGSPPTLADLTQLASDIAAYFATTYKAILDTNFTWNSVWVRQVIDPTTVDSRLEAQAVVNAAGTLAVAGHQSPAPLCGLISMQTPVASRRARGHIFLPPSYATGFLNGDVWNTGAGYWTAGVALAARFATGCSPTPTWTGTGLSGWYLACYSKRAAQLTLPHAFACTAVKMQPKVRWLRSRARGTT